MPCKICGGIGIHDTPLSRMWKQEMELEKQRNRREFENKSCDELAALAVGIAPRREGEFMSRIVMPWEYELAKEILIERGHREGSG